MELRQEQIDFYRENGFLVYDKPILSPDQVSDTLARIDDIVNRRTKFPMSNINWEKDRYDEVPRKITGLSYNDDYFKGLTLREDILDIIEVLMGAPNIKFYTDEFFMKLNRQHKEDQTYDGYHWHQDAVNWDWFYPYDHITCWIALDDADVKNGCLHFIPGSFNWGYIAKPYRVNFMEIMKDEPTVPIEIKAGMALFHHGLNFHYSGSNISDRPRRSLGLHYMKSETYYLGKGKELDQSFLDSGHPEGEHRFMLARGKEFSGRV